MSKKDRKKGKPLNNFIQYSGMAIQMGVTIGLFTWLGMKIDEKNNISSSIWTAIFSLLGVGTSLYLVLKDLLRK